MLRTLLQSLKRAWTYQTNTLDPWEEQPDPVMAGLKAERDLALKGNRRKVAAIESRMQAVMRARLQGAVQ